MEYNLVCTACGKIFTSITADRKCCSSACGLTRGKKEKKYYACQHCGNEFWRPNAFRMKYCSHECEYAARQQETEKRLNSKPTPERKVYRQVCQFCGKHFETIYPNQIYCCNGCCYSGNLRLKREQWADAYTPRTFICKECGCTVETKCGKTHSKFCSIKCEDKYFARAYKIQRKEQMKSAYREPVSFKRVYRHSHGICGICGLPVPYDKSPEKLWSATIDHIIPFSQGGTHEPDNCQLAHRLCNSMKHATTQEFHIDWEQKNRDDFGRWSEAIEELYDLIEAVPKGG